MGRKVADCVALFSLDRHDVVPVDTHMWDVAVRISPGLRAAKSLTPTVYDSVGDVFRDRCAVVAASAGCAWGAVSCVRQPGVCAPLIVAGNPPPSDLLVRAVS